MNIIFNCSLILVFIKTFNLNQEKIMQNFIMQKSIDKGMKWNRIKQQYYQIVHREIDYQIIGEKEDNIHSRFLQHAFP